jgi:hypothetical protein
MDPQMPAFWGGLPNGLGAHAGIGTRMALATQGRYALCNTEDVFVFRFACFSSAALFPAPPRPETGSNPVH